MRLEHMILLLNLPQSKQSRYMKLITLHHSYNASISNNMEQLIHVLSLADREMIHLRRLEEGHLIS